ncbi:S1C family serine protease [Streptomyces sp. SA3_actF]|uniref:S1C family serine protease n=1 Tax=Streptomyces sp. SA3_actF TaxID=682181 RepID=UPI000D0AA47B|nr:trypsin-like peptidase domain-containing protein [Streptomyces sp. SA3_actF]
MDLGERGRAGADDGPVEPWAGYDPWESTPATPTGVRQPAPRPAGPAYESAPEPSGEPGVAGPAARRDRRRRPRRARSRGPSAAYLGARYERDGGARTLVLARPRRRGPTRPAGSVADLAARSLPGVVTLRASGAAEAGTGTGFVLDDRGHILTNNHVVAPAAGGGALSVTFSGGQTLRAEVVGRDAGYDLAVVRVRGVKNLTPLALGDSEGVQVGDPVVALGSPFDLPNTVTAGIISAKERPVTAAGEGEQGDISYVDALQTDAPLNPGNSGGPLLDATGHVIGVNSAIRSAGGTDEGQAGSVGLGFAIPVNQARWVAGELLDHGRVAHPVIGVALDSREDRNGALIGGDKDAVTPGGPADRAGLAPGDLVTAADDRPVTSTEDLIVRIRAHRPGDRLRLTYVREGKEHHATVTLEAAD